MGSVIEIAIIMLVVATLAFAPLGYFIYMYTQKNGEPFGDIEPHEDKGSALLDLIGKVFSRLSSNKD